MNINKYFKTFDAWQQRHAVVGFPLALLKKFGEDSAGYQAALLTYYGFLSLFPLILVLLTILQIWFQNDPIFQNQVSTSVGHFFPLLGGQLQGNLHGIHKAGIGLAIGIIITFYGARGAADAFRFGLGNVWHIPLKKRPGFPKNLLHSLAIMIAAGAGFAATLAVTVFTSALGHATWVKILVNILGFAILVAVLGYTFRVATLGHIARRAMLTGTCIAAAALQLLLTFGGILVAHELKKLDALYGTFAVVLGLLFWLYLISLVVMYATEIDTVRHFKLYPRSTSGRLLTDADKRANQQATTNS